MTLDEAIGQYTAYVDAEKMGITTFNITTREAEQLAEWLKELERYRKVRRILSQNRIATDRYGEVVLWDDIKRILTEVQDANSN